MKSKVKSQKAKFFKATVKRQKAKLLLSFSPFLLFAFSLAAQTGGQYEIKKSVISNGGGQSDGAPYSVTGTAAQASAGVSSSGGGFGVRGGFWQPNLAPTAANVSVSGQVLTASGQGIRNARMTLTNSTGTTRTAITSSFGYYSFDEVEVGQTYVVSVRSKRFQFANNTQVVSVNDEITALTFTALPE